MYTQREKGAIRRHWSYLQLRFHANGTVEARPGKGHAWGILYSRNDAIRHLQAIGLRLITN